MPDSKASPLEKTLDRPKMHKRVEQKEDGRVLIYYTFDQTGEEEKKNVSRADKQ